MIIFVFILINISIRTSYNKFYRITEEPFRYSGTFSETYDTPVHEI